MNFPASDTTSTPVSLLDGAVLVLRTAVPTEKVRLSQLICKTWRAGDLEIGHPVDLPEHPARPEIPRLIPASRMPRRKFANAEGRAALLHSIAHIELNAIDLAWDLIARFTATIRETASETTVRDFCNDWVTVANDEARHFSLLAGILTAHETPYGFFPAHDGLWQSAQDTRHDLMARLAIVPMVLEARGLDVTPAIIKRLHQANRPAEADALEQIYNDEIGHVAAGVKWFRFMSESVNQVPQQAWQQLVKRHFRGKIKGPFDHAGRQKPGFLRIFSSTWIDQQDQRVKKKRILLTFTLYPRL